MSQARIIVLTYSFSSDQTNQQGLPAMKWLRLLAIDFLATRPSSVSKRLIAMPFRSYSGAAESVRTAFWEIPEALIDRPKASN